MGKTYTKKGDDGTTQLTNGKRVKKSCETIELYGLLDELNSFLGFAAESLCHERHFAIPLKSIYRVQRELFSLANNVISGDKYNFGLQLTAALEEEIDHFEAGLPIMSSFVLPGGGESSVRLHLARSVCRRTERFAYKLTASLKNAEIIAVYLNRLGDWLYVLARYIAFESSIEETTV
jgi:cob(I)alamin adenosyltransferase